MLHGAANHYHFETAPGMVHDAEAFLKFLQSPAAVGKYLSEAADAAAKIKAVCSARAICTFT